MICLSSATVNSPLVLFQIWDVKNSLFPERKGRTKDVSAVTKRVINEKSDIFFSGGGLGYLGQIMLTLPSGFFCTFNLVAELGFEIVTFFLRIIDFRKIS